jgi:hypothetical protein
MSFMGLTPMEVLKGERYDAAADTKSIADAKQNKVNENQKLKCSGEQEVWTSKQSSTHKNQLSNRTDCGLIPYFCRMSDVRMGD